MTGTAADVIRVAKSEVGYHEGYSGGHWNNKQKFSPAVPGLEWSQNQAWCATFCTWAFQEAGMPKDSYPVTASCALGVAWWKKANRFSEYPAIGAQVFFGPGGGSHTGLVYAYDTTYIYTVEGNTNSSGSAEGDGVYLKKRARQDAYVYGYGYPAYAAGIVTADPSWKNPTTPSKETDVALTSAEINKIAQTTAAAVLTLDGKISIPGASKTNPTYTLASTQTEILKRIDKVAATEVAQTAALTALAKLVGSGADTATIVAAVRSEIQTQIENAVIKVDVAVTGNATKES
ncbi:CHAP domain-containing protein [Streptomyces sp. NPDC002131]|uniref:CHAP domain-containing protein n=1 Tax=Streptomyces sp. NPDC002131 TaxID=3154535 RepID=UPI00332ABCBB